MYFAAQIQNHVNLESGRSAAVNIIRASRGHLPYYVHGRKVSKTVLIAAIKQGFYDGYMLALHHSGEYRVVSAEDWSARFPNEFHPLTKI